MIYKVTQYYRGGSQGWSEGYAFLNASPNPGDIAPTVEAIANARVKMLGREFECHYIRIARYATDAGVRSKGKFGIKKSFKNPNQTAAYAAEPADVAYIVNGFPSIGQVPSAFDGNENQLFLGAPVDQCVDNAGKVSTDKAGLLAAFGDWANLMRTTSAGWLADTIIGDTHITTITQLGDGTVELVLDATGFAPLTVGKYYRARVRRVNNGKSPLNNEWVVRATGAATVRTTEQIGINPSSSGGLVKVYKPVKDFVDFGNLVLQLEVGNHKRGRPFGTTRGRSPTIIRY